MARLARLVVPGVPHHVTQRGARRLQVFFRPADYRLYRLLLRRESRRNGLSIWAYCMMPNHVHLIAVPETVDCLARTLRRVHGRYAELVNRRLGCKGHLWQERFHSCPMDERHLWSAVRYVLLNPVRAGLTTEPEAWPWSSARAHVHGADDSLADIVRVRGRFPAPLSAAPEPPDHEDFEAVRSSSRTGRFLAAAEDLPRLEGELGMRLFRRPRGRPRG